MHQVYNCDDTAVAVASRMREGGSKHCLETGEEATEDRKMWAANRVALLKHASGHYDQCQQFGRAIIV